MNFHDHRGGSSQLDERDDFLRAVVDEARVLTGGQSSALCLLDSSTSRVKVLAGSGEFEGRAGDEAQAEHGISGWMLTSGTAVSCQWCDAACCPFAPSARHHHLVVPVRGGSRVRGLMCATSATTSGLGRSRESTLVELAGMAGSCLGEERVLRLAEALGALAARQRMAADLHDGVAQNLVRVHMQLEAALTEVVGDRELPSALLAVRDTLTETIDDFRAAIESLRNPPGSADQRDDLSAVLASAVRDARIPAGTVVVNAVRGCLVPRTIAEQIRRVVLEALGNASRHAHARRIRVGLRSQHRQTVVTVTDNGCGMDLGGEDVPPGRHFGLDVMRLRAASIGGQLEIRSTRGCGTEVTLRWADIT